MMKVNNKEIKATKFAFDGCHKIYLIEDTDDEKKAREYEYEILPITELEKTYKNSCELVFINTWKLESVVPQFKEANFEV